MAHPPPFASNVAQPPERPILLWDGDCGFCKRCAMWLKSQTGDVVAYERYQGQLGRFPELCEEALAYAVHFVETDGCVYHSAHAIYRAAAYSPGRECWLRRYEKSRAFAAASEMGYRIVASNRMFFSKLTKLIFGPPKS